MGDLAVLLSLHQSLFDLRGENDRLVNENARLREAAGLAADGWLLESRGTKALKERLALALEQLARAVRSDVALNPSAATDREGEGDG